MCLGIEPQLTYSKMRKVILVTLILALTLPLVLTGCGPAPTSTPVPKPTLAPLQLIGAAVVLVGISLARRR